MDESAIDETYRELQAGSGAEFVVELVATFLEEAPKTLAELRTARANGDAEKFRRAAHSLKSNGNTFGALRLATASRVPTKDYAEVLPAYKRLSALSVCAPLSNY